MTSSSACQSISRQATQASSNDILSTLPVMQLSAFSFSQHGGTLRLLLLLVALLEFACASTELTYPGMCFKHVELPGNILSSLVLLCCRV